MCVKQNTFSFDEFYRMLKNMNKLDYISDRRLNRSLSDQEWRIEQPGLEAKRHDVILQIEHIVLNSAKETAEYRNTMKAMSIVAAEQKA